ncbi:myristylated tegument protein [Equid alphaherpesvirus 3]|uniref:Cytoplasmic envelopment protein 3 n=1 Tax=Equid alphaherpesvirus 3 TaxID=80341 RepID=A0A077BCM6_9ALPH|nr:myristylated tegument protein [Equid alphaherpesvirus 3]AIL02968.1 myristylated tegument protein [Equid alphaherpesvirus 3]
MGQRLSCGCCRTNQLVTNSGEVVSLNADTFEEFSLDDFDLPADPRPAVAKQPAPRRGHVYKPQRNPRPKRRDPY